MRLFIGASVLVLLIVAPGAADGEGEITLPSGVGALVEMHLLEIPADVPVARLLTVWHDALGVPSPGRWKHVVHVDAATAAQVLARAEKIGTTRTTTRTWVLDGQPAILYDKREETYVQDYDVEVQGGTAEVWPIIGTIRDGVWFTVTPEAAASGWRVRLEGRFSAVVRPIEVFRTKLASADQEVEIQLPELRLVGVSETSDVPGEAAWFLVGTPVTWSDVQGRKPTTRVVLVRAARATFRPLQLVGPDDEEDGR